MVLVPEGDSFEINLRTGAPTTGPTEDGSPPRPAATPRASRFAPGTLLGGRYRIAGLLGRGGMGEVYRADDLRLGEVVALKFLAQSLSANPARRARFVAEAKVARKLTHTNLCRVHDFVEADGECFLSMEYVAGEDLASLLKRSGRLAPEQALDVAQQLCLGLAAAHERGVLHRDLKPANVMLDERGRVRLMDFGLAALANEINAEDVLAGTPRYMAPEQLRGVEATLRSDLYSLGLVLHEIFAGRFPAGGDLDEVEADSPLADLHPDVLRTIAMCLDSEPARRPQSAIAVAAMLPGGDPLGASIKAGELPSPAMVAAAAPSVPIAPRVVTALLACAILGAALVATWTVTQNPYFAGTSWQRSPDVLVDRAKDVARALGHTSASAHAAAGISVDVDYLAALRSRSGSDRFDPIRDPRPGAASVWWRQSPRSLATFGPDYLTTPLDPAPIDGDVLARVTMAGDLVSFRARGGPDSGSVASKRRASDAVWSDLFDRAGLAKGTFHEVEPGPPPALPHDSLRAWERAASSPDDVVRIDGSTLDGAVVRFDVRRGFDVEDDVAAPAPGSAVLEDVVRLGAFIAFMAIAARNVRRRRGDVRAASRFGVFLAVCGALYWATRTRDFTSGGGLFWMVTHGVGQALFGGLFGAAAYLAIEPFVRRRIPHILVSSTRILEGRFRDSLVGRDLLAGAAGAFGVELLVAAMYGLGALGVDFSNPPRQIYETLGLYGFSDGLAQFLKSLHQGPTTALLLGGIFALLDAVTKRRRLAITLMVLLGGILFAKHWYFESGALNVVFGTLTAAIGSFVLVRFGVLASVVFGVCAYANATIPVTFDLRAWYAPSQLAYVIAITALLAWGTHAALARPRPLPVTSSSTPSR